MREWEPASIAELTGAQLVGWPAAGTPAMPGALGAPGPTGASVDSRELAPGELFVGLRGEREDGGAHAAHALAAGAWGVLVTPEHARAVALREGAGGGVVLAHAHPLGALQALAHAWRLELRRRGAKVVAITGSTGKTSTKDILAALLSARQRVAASPANHNTEIGLPLALLAAEGNAQVVVLEMAMRGAGQIALLTEIAEPDVGVIVNIGPAHLELLGSLEAIAAAKAELIVGLAPCSTVVIPAAEPLLARHLREDLHTVTFGEGGDVQLVEERVDGRVVGRRRPGQDNDSAAAVRVVVTHAGEEIELRPSFSQAHNLRNLLAAVAAARALGHTPSGRVEVEFSARRGQRERLANGVLLIDDCYNANPMSMRAAIDDLAEADGARRVAVLGDMLELGPGAERMHREIGEHAHARGVELLIAVGPLAAEMSRTFTGESRCVTDASAASGMLGGLLRDGDAVLVKGSRGVGLEQVVDTLRRAGERPVAASALAPGRR